MFDWMKAVKGAETIEPLAPDNPLIEGTRLTIARDPEDQRYDIITYRRVGNIVSGGPSRPECDLKGIAAVRRWVRMMAAETAGHVMDNRQVQRAMQALHHRFRDPT